MMSRTMTQALLPKRVDGPKLVEVNQHLSGKIDSKQLTRLSAATLGCDPFVECVADFDRDDERHRLLTGRCEAKVVMECQRCLEDVSLDIRSEFALAMVFNDDQAKALPKRLEPIELDEDGRLELWEIFEDELLLCLPDFPMHPEGECQAYSTGPEQDTAEEVKRPNPFDVLAQLKQK
ncbi:MAG: YceD family protein [Pseudomonadota bacterium]|nr:YceD family protein [Pseudomonadota bacterium]